MQYQTLRKGTALVQPQDRAHLYKPTPTSARADAVLRHRFLPSVGGQQGYSCSAMAQARHGPIKLPQLEEAG